MELALQSIINLRYLQQPFQTKREYHQPDYDEYL